MTGPLIAGAKGRAMREAGELLSLSATKAVSVRVWIQGVFPVGTDDAAQRSIVELVAQSLVPVRGVRVRLGAHRDPAVHFPVVAQGNIDLADGLVRAQVNAATGREAILLLEARLRYQLDRAVPGASRFRRLPLPHPWVAPYPRPPQTRRIARVKVVHPAVLGVDQAVGVMERRDYGFHLFVETGNGQGSVVYRAGTAKYRLAQVVPGPELLAPYSVALSCFDRPVPRLGTAEAADRLGLSEVAFLFFFDLDRRGGAVLYRRYDGHYGLICPPG
jgi:hypothetical protein